MTEQTTKSAAPDPLAGGQNPDGRNPWLALWALVLGFFMILVDSTIVSVATDSILVGLQTDLNSVVWVTSAYLLAYVVPLLVSGRLGDQFGPKRIYLIGLVIFTLASAWCGLSGSVEMLIAARAVQGLGAALMTPQTMAVITRTFPPAKRGTAMSLWGSVAGIAILVGPLAGGFLVDNFGWEWIFFVNVPVGIVAFVLALRLVPRLPTQRHRFDVLGIALSAVGLFLLTFGLQEGQKNDWDAQIWWMIGGGVVVLIAFVGWQAICPSEPLMSLSLFRDRNFTLGNVGIAAMGFAVTGMAIPFMLFAQKAMGLSPMRAALLMVPLAVMSGALARPVGKLTDRVHPRYLAGIGFTLASTALWWLGAVASPTASVVQIVLPIALLGFGSAFIWAPLSATATRNLPLRLAGAGAGVYNMTRQVGAVLGSAAVGVLMQNQIQSKLAAAARDLPAGAPAPSAEALQSARGALPEPLRAPFADAMGHSLWLPAAALVIGLIAVLNFAKPSHVGHGRPAAATRPDPAAVASAEAPGAAGQPEHIGTGAGEVGDPQAAGAGGRHEAAGGGGRHETAGVAAPGDAPGRHRAD